VRTRAVPRKSNTTVHILTIQTNSLELPSNNKQMQFLLWFAALATASLTLDLDYLSETLYIEERNVFKNEFPNCIAPETVGVRRLLRFGLQIHNSDEEERVYRSNYPIIHYSTEFSNGTITVLCLRDSICTKPAFFTCRPLAISPNCTSRTLASEVCQWIDITDANSSSSLTIGMEFEEQTYELVVDLAAVPPGPGHPIALCMSVLALVNLLFILVPYVGFRVTAAVANKRDRAQ
jgi:hypothetical protein